MRTESSVHPIEYLLELTRARGARAIPVTGSQVERDADCLRAVGTVMNRTGDGVCLRLERDEVDEPELLRVLAQ